jgi:hypothetical protein
MRYETAMSKKKHRRHRHKSKSFRSSRPDSHRADAAPVFAPSATNAPVINLHFGGVDAINRAASMQTQADNLRNMFTGAAFSDPMQHAKMARDIGVDPIGVSGGYDPEVPISGEAGEPPLKPHDTPMSGEAGEPPLNPDDHMPGPERTFANARSGPDEPTPRRRRPTLSNSDTFTSSYEPKMDPFRRHVERVFEGIGVVQIPDFVHDSYDDEIAGHYKAHKEKEESMREMHRRNLEERDENHVHELREMHNKYAREMHKIKTERKDTAQRYTAELSRLSQQLQNARTRPAMADSEAQAGETRPAMADSEAQADEYESAHTSRYDENRFSAGDKRRPSPFREQLTKLEPADKYTYIWESGARVTDHMGRVGR